jgi:predicted nucleic acid-binding protein
VRLVIADTGPINYLVLIGRIDLLAELFETVILPAAVRAELTSRNAPPAVQQWIADPPGWLEVSETPLSQNDDASLKGIDIGERAAIQLAVALRADLLLIDDRKGVHAAERKGLVVTGTLGVLDLAARRGLIDFSQAIAQLRRTNFRIPEALLDALLKRHAARRGDA